MEIRYHLDEHMPHAVAEGLRRLGVDATTSSDGDLLGASDSGQMAFAAAEGRVLVTRDRDHLALAKAGADHAGIAFWPAKRKDAGRLVRDLARLHAAITAEEMVGRIEFV
jgi:hypothetical protein